MLAFAIFITHALACYVAIDITWNEYVSKRFNNGQGSVVWEYVTRTSLVLITCESFLNKDCKYLTHKCIISVLLAVAIPSLELFISLFGALCLSALGKILIIYKTRKMTLIKYFSGLAFPALIQTCVFWKTSSGFAKCFMVFKNIFITIVAVLGLVIGTTTSLSEIIKEFFH